MEMLAQNNVFTEQGGYSERKKWTRQWLRRKWCPNNILLISERK
jgi:hypothetical protein